MAGLKFLKAKYIYVNVYMYVMHMLVVKNLTN